MAKQFTENQEVLNVFQCSEVKKPIKVFSINLFRNQKGFIET